MVSCKNSHAHAIMYPRFWKSGCVFIVGSGIGFIFAFLLLQSQDKFFGSSEYAKLWRKKHAVKDFQFQLPFYNTNGAVEIVFQHWKTNDKLFNVTYQEWLKGEQWKAKDIDQDEFLYGPKEKEKLPVKVESDWLMDNIHITCVVFLKKIELARAINATWGLRCNELYFFGQYLHDPQLNIKNIDGKLQSSWQLLCEAMNHIFKQNKTLQWIIFAKDDTIVIPENLRYMVAPLNYTQDYYLGHSVVMWGQSYNEAQAGYVLSISAMKKIVAKFNTSEKCLLGGKYWKKEDYYLGKHLASMKIHPSDTRDQYLRSTFHRYSLPNLLWGAVNPSDNWTPIYQSCCSPFTVTFSAGETDKMYTYNYVLYYLQALNSMGIFGGRPAPTPVPEEDVWKIALKEEFNITYWQNITSQKYFEIWSSSNWEVHHPPGMRYEHMPEVLSAVLTAYELQNNSTKRSNIK